ncbi:hypothetical protein TanjilG_01964 [Lupinus angustifolius]|nr:hypothetical protein TanjilG_01964 [Lupinus angustifolius]
MTALFIFGNKITLTVGPSGERQKTTAPTIIGLRNKSGGRVVQNFYALFLAYLFVYNHCVIFFVSLLGDGVFNLSCQFMFPVTSI